MSHYDAAEQQLAYADAVIHGNADAMLKAAQTHAVLALIDCLEELSAIVVIPK